MNLNARRMAVTTFLALLLMLVGLFLMAPNEMLGRRPVSPVQRTGPLPGEHGERGSTRPPVRAGDRAEPLSRPESASDDGGQVEPGSDLGTRTTRRGLQRDLESYRELIQWLDDCQWLAESSSEALRTVERDIVGALASGDDTVSVESLSVYLNEHWSALSRVALDAQCGPPPPSDALFKADSL